MTQTPNGTALAKTSDEAWLRKRAELNQKARYGLEQASADQLNVILILSKRWGLDPVTDITLYQGHPWVTIDGMIRIIRRHPDYVTLQRRPLTEQERIDGGWNKTDIVWQADIHTRAHGILTDWGKVTREEQQSNAPVGKHPVEVCMKRALVRAGRLAFGRDIPDDEDIEAEVQAEMAQRSDPQRQAALAQRHREIFDDEQDFTPTRERDVQDAARIVDQAKSAARDRDADLAEVDRQRREEGLI